MHGFRRARFAAHQSRLRLYVKVVHKQHRIRRRGDDSQWVKTPNKKTGARALGWGPGCEAFTTRDDRSPSSNCQTPANMPATTGKELHQRRLLWVEAVRESCVPFGVLGTPMCQLVFAAVTGGRSPAGDWRRLATTDVPLAAAYSDALAVERM